MKTLKEIEDTYKILQLSLDNIILDLRNQFKIVVENVEYISPVFKNGIKKGEEEKMRLCYMTTLAIIDMYTLNLSRQLEHWKEAERILFQDCVYEIFDVDKNRIEKARALTRSLNGDN